MKVHSAIAATTRLAFLFCAFAISAVGVAEAQTANPWVTVAPSGNTN